MNFETKHFFTKIDSYTGVIDLMMLDKDVLPISKKFKKRGQTWYYLNRIIVSKKIRHKGVATQLMQEMVDWADCQKINILLEINPYGDLDLDQLIAFYGKFGFKHYGRRKDAMIRVVY